MLALDSSIIDKYKSGMSSIALGLEYKCCDKTIINYLRKHDIRIKNKGEHLIKYPIQENYFDIWSADSAYILGYIMADGCMYISDTVRELRLNCSDKDLPILNFINEQICFNKNRIKNINRLLKRTQKYYTSHLMILRGKYFIDRLLDLCIIPRKTGLEQIPHECPKILIPNFIRGYCDGDGCFGIYKYQNKLQCILDISSKSEILISQLKNYFVFGNVTYSNKMYHYKISQIKDITKFGNIIYNGEFCLNRKYSKFLDIQHILYRKINSGEIDILKDTEYQKEPILKESC